MKKLALTILTSTLLFSGNAQAWNLLKFFNISHWFSRSSQSTSIKKDTLMQTTLQVHALKQAMANSARDKILSSNLPPHRESPVSNLAQQHPASAATESRWERFKMWLFPSYAQAIRRAQEAQKAQQHAEEQAKKTAQAQWALQEQLEEKQNQLVPLQTAVLQNITENRTLEEKQKKLISVHIGTLSRLGHLKRDYTTLKKAIATDLTNFDHDFKNASQQILAKITIPATTRVEPIAAAVSSSNGHAHDASHEGEGWQFIITERHLRDEIAQLESEVMTLDATPCTNLSESTLDRIEEEKHLRDLEEKYRRTSSRISAITEHAKNLPSYRYIDQLKDNDFYKISLRLQAIQEEGKKFEAQYAQLDKQPLPNKIAAVKLTHEKISKEMNEINTEIQKLLSSQQAARDRRLMHVQQGIDTLTYQGNLTNSLPPLLGYHSNPQGPNPHAFQLLSKEK